MAFLPVSGFECAFEVRPDDGRTAQTLSTPDMEMHVACQTDIFLQTGGSGPCDRRRRVESSRGRTPAAEAFRRQREIVAQVLGKASPSW
jgi:hypothetical protein